MVLEIKVAKVSQNVAKKNPSCGLVKARVKVPGWMMKRAHIVKLTVVKSTRLKRNMTFPSVVRPSKRYGTVESTKATPPVDIVHVYQASVKCFRRSLRVIFSIEASFLGSYTIMTSVMVFFAKYLP